MKSTCRNGLLNSKWGLEAREVGFEDGGEFCGFRQKPCFKFCGFGQKQRFKFCGFGQKQCFKFCGFGQK